MSEEKLLDDLHLSDSHKTSTCKNSLIPHLNQILCSCSQLNESEELADFLNSVAVSVVEQADNLDSERIAFEILTEIDRFITSPSLNQEVIDALLFELPKAVCKFACASKRCSEIVEHVVDHLIVTCSPREMMSMLCDALSSPSEMFRVPSYFASLLGGIAKVISLIPRRQFEVVKAAVPVILRVLKSMSSEADDEERDFEELFCKTIGIADSIQSVCKKLEETYKKKLSSLLGLFVLQVMALASLANGHNISSSLPVVLHLSHLLPFSGLSFIGLITGSDVDKMTNILHEDDEDDLMSCFSHVKHGASLAVIWGYRSNEVAVAANAVLAAVENELQMNQTKRWQAIGMLKHVFASTNLPWDLKTHALDFLLSIMLKHVLSKEMQDEHIDYSTYMPTLYTGLQAITMVIMYAPNAVLRKKSFDAFKKVLADVPSSLRFDILKALIQNGDSSSMIAILLDCVKSEMHVEYSRGISMTSGILEAAMKASPCSSFWGAGVLEIMELVLKPPKGGPPFLPDYSDAVLSALNLYRFVLIKESSGETNYTGVLSKDNLQKAYNEWLLPLRTLVTGIVAENQEYDELETDLVCALNPVELVLYRCIELVEEKVKCI